ncbi:MAG: pantetheine-phosphate adenylyltransferase [Clostridiales bacterium]|nr:pantetheine-phosphate adenylyltransferase [Clostridiales bacterium]MCD7828001.1 pantetheine-phosphate adenylyltransferase [Clostridiales bacterium]
MCDIAICPGSFDPVTNGHLDIIKRASEKFDKIIVLVSYNAKKNGGTFTVSERVDFLKRCLTDIPNVTVDSYDGLLVDYARKVGASAIVKGLRAVSDFEEEFQMALINRQLAPEVDTVFMVSSLDYMYLSSSTVREICYFGGNIENFVPAEIVPDIVKKISKKKQI